MDLTKEKEKMYKVAEEIFGNQFHPDGGGIGLLGELIVQLQMPFSDPRQIQLSKINKFVKKMGWDSQNISIDGRTSSDMHFVCIVLWADKDCAFFGLDKD
jgi:hypothetical protein